MNGVRNESTHRYNDVKVHEALESIKNHLVSLALIKEINSSMVRLYEDIN